MYLSIIILETVTIIIMKRLKNLKMLSTPSGELSDEDYYVAEHTITMNNVWIGFHLKPVQCHHDG